MTDFSTPEGAVLALEEAYRRRDLEGAVACKDFRTEARLMLKRLENPPPESDEEILGMAAQALELSFRASLQNDGFPNFEGLVSRFPDVLQVEENVVMVTEVCRYPDGGESRQRLLVAKGPDGWRVLNPLDDDAAA